MPPKGEEEPMRPTTEKFSDSLERLFLENDRQAAAEGAERSNVQMATRFYRALGEQDLNSAKACLAANVYHKIHGPEDFGPSGEAKGPDAMLEHMTSVFGLLENQTPRALQVIAQGDMVAVFYRDSGRIMESGADYDVVGVHRIEFQDGKIVRFENLFDTASLERSLKRSKAHAL